ncbi:MAG: glycine zipper domain-containing protein [Pseudomonadales bacterium]
MKKSGTLHNKAMLILAAALLCSGARAQEMVIYPKQGQSPEQQEKDRFECYRFGRDTTGFDPMALPTATAPRPEQTGPSAGQRAVRGAVVGGAVGAITGNSSKAKKYAGAGAATGALVGGMKSADTKRAQEQWEREQQAQYAQRRNHYNRAFAACMEGREYTVR